MENLKDQALKSEKLTELINEAAPLKVRVKKDLAEKMQINCNDFLSEVAKSDSQIQKIWQKKRKERTEAESETLGKWIKTQRKKFKTITKMLSPKPNTDPLKGLVDKITEIVQFARYIESTDLENRLAKFGISIDVTNLEDQYPYFKDADVKTVVKDIFSQSKETQDDINSTNEEIKSRIFEELDDNLKYSPSNPSGLKSSQFTKLVNTKAVSIMKSKDQYTKFKDNLLKKDKADIESREIVFEKNKEL